jgi:chromosome segregation ATPase
VQAEFLQSQLEEVESARAELKAQLSKVEQELTARLQQVQAEKDEAVSKAAQLEHQLAQHAQEIKQVRYLP